MSLFADDHRMLVKIVRALMAYYGPITIIQTVIAETDTVIKDMAVAGHIQEAKEFSAVLEQMKTCVSHT